VVAELGLTAGSGLAEAGAALQSMALQLPEFGLLAMAIGLTLMAGGINLAIVATANLAAIAAALCWAALGPAAAAAPWGLALGLAAGLASGAACGALSGLAIGLLEITPILATLCAMLVLGGAGVLLTGGAAISGMPPAITAAAGATFAGVPWVLLLFLALAAALQWLVSRTAFGLRLRMHGLNPQAAHFSGVDTQRMLVQVYALSGGIAALAGLVMLGRFNSARAGYGESYLLVAILAAVMGGIHPDGGRGSFRGLALAVIVLQAAASALNLLSASPHLTLIVWGLLLLAKLALDRIRAAPRAALPDRPSVGKGRRIGKAARPRASSQRQACGRQKRSP
jgi:ribose/xylose/arabinose/galactoside ABC-type transport system permease subunit